MSHKPLIFLDTETTGLESARMIQLAYKKHGDTSTFVEYYKAPCPIDFEAMGVHHITEKMVADKSPFANTETAKSLPTLLESSILVAHNAAFDISILKNEGVTTHDYICTYKVACHLYDFPNLKLQSLRYRWGIEIADAIAHDAAGDVAVLEQVFEYMLNDFMTKNAVSKDDAVARFVALTQEPVLLKKLDFGKHRGVSFDDLLAKEPDYLKWLGTLQDKSVDFIHTVKHYLAKLP